MGNSEKDSTSKSINETVNGSHQFTVKGYSLAKGMGPGKCLSSDVFTVGGYDWAIYFYPDGKNPEDGALYVSVFIALASEGTDVRALFELTLVDQSGKGKHKVHSHFDRALESGPYTLKYRGSMGYKRFFKRTSLETSDYIKDDCLLINCTVGVVRNRLEGPKQYSIPVPPSDMGQGLKDLLESEIGCDIVFEVGDETFKAHKLILAARSPVFRAQFYGLVGDRNLDKVVVKDVEPSIFKVMLLFSSYSAFISTWKRIEKNACSEGFKHLEESCPSLLSELLKTLASGDDTSSLSSNRKRSGSSIYALDLAGDGAAAESANPNGRRVRR
ncbi:hypothetical protein CUMW_191980, partial [Citrus unshiu]